MNYWEHVSGSFELALAPDSNINRATSATTLDTVIAPLNLSKDARQRSGLGLKGSGQGYLRVDLGKNVTLVPRLSGQGAFYRASQFSDMSGSAQLGLEWRSKADRITPSAGYTWRWYGNELYARTQTLSVDWLHPIGKRAQLNTNIGVSRALYIRNALQDGMIYTGSITYERALTTRSGGSIALSANRQTARDPGYATASGGLGLVYWHDFGKMTLFGTVTTSRLEADTKLFLFPERRKEWYARGGVVLSSATCRFPASPRSYALPMSGTGRQWAFTTIGGFPRILESREHFRDGGRRPPQSRNLPTGSSRR